MALNEELLNVDTTIDYDTFDNKEMDYSFTLKQIYDLINISHMDTIEPLAFNSSYMALELLESDLDTYLRLYQSDLTNDVINRLIEVKEKVSDLMNCLK